MRSHKSRVRPLLLGLALAVLLAVVLLRHPLRRWLFRKAVLANDAPTAALVHKFVRTAPDPPAALVTLWKTGKIVPREQALLFLPQVVPDDKPLPGNLQQLLHAAALDPDMDLREAALGILADRHDPDLPALAAAQLQDVDPLVRFLGVSYLKPAPANIGVPLTIPLLDDLDPRVVGMALKALEAWSGEDFGIRMADVAPVQNKTTGLEEFRRESFTRAHAAAMRAKAWWASHKQAFPPVPLRLPDRLRTLHPIKVKDFSLPSLEGPQVRLSEFRGKVVLINFWTTWCTACLAEMPELIALRKRHLSNLVILGVSLDFVQVDDATPPPSPKSITRKIARTVKARGINYPILLDKTDSIGARFNGGELPTTVILDAQGRLRRRFIGQRPLAVFEAMVAQAARPYRAPQLYGSHPRKLSP